MTAKYSNDHEWVIVENGVATIGITNHAQEQLGDVVFIELPAIGKKVAAHEVPAHISNVSVTGAAILGPPTVPWNAGDRIVVRSQGADNVVVVRHRHDTPNGTRFGVELTRSATTLKASIKRSYPLLVARRPSASTALPDIPNRVRIAWRVAEPTG